MNAEEHKFAEEMPVPAHPIPARKFQSTYWLICNFHRSYNHE